MYMNFVLSLVCSVLSSTGDLLTAIERDFGSFDEFRAEMTAKTVAIKGSGWGWLVSEGGGRGGREGGGEGGRRRRRWEGGGKGGREEAGSG